MKHHGLQLEDWQLSASLLLLPLEPQPYFCDTKDCHVDRGEEWRWTPPQTHAMWGVDEVAPSLVYECLTYQEGDLIYYQEKWIDDIPPAISATGYATQADFPYPIDPAYRAESMPPVAAREWRVITGVEVLQSRQVRELRDFAAANMYSEDEAQDWCELYQVNLHDPDLWLIALSVEPCGVPEGVGA
jgi:hypothetical protein